MGIELIASTQFALASGNPITTAWTFTQEGNQNLALLGLLSTATAREGAPTLNGSAMTLLATANNAASSTGIMAEMWYHHNPATGSLAISVPNAAAPTRRIALSLSCVDGTVLRENNATYGTASSTSISISSVSTAGGFIGCLYGHHGAAAAKSNNYTMLFTNDEGDWNSQFVYGLGAVTTAAGSSFTVVNASSDIWAGVAFSLKPFVVVSATPSSPHSHSIVASPGMTQRQTLSVSSPHSHAVVASPAVNQQHSVTVASPHSHSLITTPTITVIPIVSLSPASPHSHAVVSSPGMLQRQTFTVSSPHSHAVVTGPGVSQTHSLNVSSVHSHAVITSPGIGATGTVDLTVQSVHSHSVVTAPAVSQKHLISPSNAIARSIAASPSMYQRQMILVDSIIGRAIVMSPSLSGASTVAPISSRKPTFSRRAAVATAPAWNVDSYYTNAPKTRKKGIVEGRVYR